MTRWEKCVGNFKPSFIDKIFHSHFNQVALYFMLIGSLNSIDLFHMYMIWWVKEHIMSKWIVLF